MFNKLLETYTDITSVATGINGLIKKILGPVLMVIGVMAVIFAIYLGVMYAKAEDSSKRKEVQGRLIGAVIGAVIIVVAATLCLSINWVSVFENFSGESLSTKTPETEENIASLIRLMIR